MTGNKKKTQKGIGLLEMVISIAIFASSILMIAQIFLRINEGQRNIIAAQNVQESIKYAMEVMSKEIRNPIRASDDSCISSGDVYGEVGNSMLKLLNQSGECVTYEILNDNGVSRLAITRNLDQVFVTPDDIDVTNFWVSVNNTNQDRVTFVLDVEAVGRDIDSQNLKIQTTISARLYD